MAFEGISYNIAVSLASQSGVINNNKKATQFLKGTYATKIISWKKYLLGVSINASRKKCQDLLIILF